MQNSEIIVGATYFGPKDPVAGLGGIRTVLGVRGGLVSFRVESGISEASEAFVSHGNMPIVEFREWTLGHAERIAQVPVLDFLRKGFLPVVYEGQQGIFFRRDTRLSSMPNAGKHLPDDDLILSNDIAITEVTPDGEVQMMLDQSDIHHEIYELGTVEADELVKDSAAGRLEMSVLMTSSSLHVLTS